MLSFEASLIIKEFSLNTGFIFLPKEMFAKAISFSYFSSICRKRGVKLGGKMRMGKAIGLIV